MSASPAESWELPPDGARRPADNQAAAAALIAELAKALTQPPHEAPVNDAHPARRVPPARILLTPEEAGKGLGIGRTTVYALMKSGELESVQIGRLRRIPTSALHEYAARLVHRARNQDL